MGRVGLGLVVVASLSMAAVTLGCAADSESPGTGGTAGVGGFGGFGGTGGSGGGGPAFCTNGTRVCHCTNGMTSSQSCFESSQGTAPFLGQCDCPTAGSGGSGGSAGGDPPALCTELQELGTTCGAESFFSPKLPASLLFLVDRSGSMLCNAPPEQSTAECETGPLAATTKTPGQPTKWRLTADALRSALSALSATGGVKAGLTLFSNNNVCGVQTMPNVRLQDLDVTHATSIANALDQVQPAGATPIVGGTLLAYQHLHWEASAGCQNPPCGAPGNRFVVLITDGADTCSMPADRMALMTTEVQKARSANIRTFVIGAPGSEPARGFLSELAFQGGTARNDGNCAHPNIDGEVGDCHFDLAESLDLSADLVAALGDVSGAALTCEFVVPGGAGIDVNVQYTLTDADPVCVPKLAESVPCDGATDGWVFARNTDGTEDRSKVLLCGPSCDSIKSDTGSRVDVIRGCQPLG